MAEIIPFPGTYKRIKELAEKFCVFLDKGDTAAATHIMQAANLNYKEKMILRGYINEFRSNQRKRSSS